MKRMIKIIVFTMILLLFPICFCNAKISHNLTEEWPGYHCYIMAYDPNALEYYPLFTFREIEGMSATKKVTNPNPQCLDVSWQSARVPIISEGTCEPNIWTIHMPSSNNDSSGICSDDTCYELTYSHWKASISQTNKFSSYPTDCIAAAFMADNIGTGNNGKIYRALYIEAGKNSDFYDDEEISYIQNNLDSNFNDDTNFCYVRKNGAGDGDVMFYFGHPIRIYDYSDDDGGYSNIFIDGEGDTGWSGFINTDIFDDVSDSIADGYIRYDYFPHGDTVKSIDDIKDYFNDTSTDKSGESYIVTDSNGQLITNQSDCLEITKEYLNTVYTWGYSEENVEAIAEVTITDTTIENENRDRDGTDFGQLISVGYSKSKAIDMCSSGNQSEWTSEYKCYKYTFLPAFGKPMYNTTVWTNKPVGCGFEQTNWSFADCKDAKLNHLHEECKTSQRVNGTEITEVNNCYNITHTGYNGVADFYVKGTNPEGETQCQDLHGFHIIYRAITIAGPILAILFVTFDFVKSIIIGDAKKVSEVRKKAIRRLIALLILFLLPIIITTLVKTLSSSSSVKDTSWLRCVIVGTSN